MKAIKILWIDGKISINVKRVIINYKNQSVRVTYNDGYISECFLSSIEKIYFN